MARDYVDVYERLIGEPEARAAVRAAPVVTAKANGGGVVH